MNAEYRKNRNTGACGRYAEVDSENSDNDDAEEQKERENLTHLILLQAKSTSDLVKHDWITVDKASTWRPGQFVEFDPHQEEIVINLLQRSPTNPEWFVWPLFQVNGGISHP